MNDKKHRFRRDSVIVTNIEDSSKRSVKLRRNSVLADKDDSIKMSPTRKVKKRDSVKPEKDDSIRVSPTRKAKKRGSIKLTSIKNKKDQIKKLTSVKNKKDQNKLSPVKNKKDSIEVNPITDNNTININKEIYDCFIKSNKIYLRNEEIQEIKGFLKSNKPILHITGNPGTGKTATVLETVKDELFEYVNYFTEIGIENRLKNTKKKILIIDEFDKFLSERKQECLRLLIKLRENKKIITISNDLRMGDLNFKAYSCNDIIEILKMKMKEIGKEFMDERCIEFLGKRFERTGDIREVFKSIVNATMGMKDKIEIKDFVNIEKRTERGIHQEMINRIKGREKDRTEVYREYLKECEETGITGVLKGDFDVIYDLIG